MTPIDIPTGRVRRLVAVILAMTATMAALVGASAPASAAACSTSSGVSVVVDFGSAGGGVVSACAPGGANTPADQVVTSAGFTIDWVTRQPGFICRVNGVPASSPCVNTPPPDAYWGIFYSDGKDGAWHYSDFGASGLEVPEGGYIGLSWQSGTRREPGQAASAHPVTTPTTAPPTAAPSPTDPPSSGSSPSTAAPTASPTTSPTGKPTKSPTKKPTSAPSSQPTASPTSEPTSAPPTSTSESPSSTDPTSSPTESPTPATTSGPGEPTNSPGESEPATEPSAESTAAPTTEPTPSPNAGEQRLPEESSRVPTWLTVFVLVVLLVAIGTSTYAARRRTRH